MAPYNIATHAQAEVKLHEPSMALDGGCADGLQCLLEVCEGATSMLQPGGFLAVETAGACPSPLHTLWLSSAPLCMRNFEGFGLLQVASRHTDSGHFWRRIAIRNRSWRMSKWLCGTICSACSGL